MISLSTDILMVPSLSLSLLLLSFIEQSMDQIKNCCCIQVAAHEAIHGGNLGVAKEALQQLYKIATNDKAAFPQGRAAVILRNYIKVTIDCAEADKKPASRELADLFGACAASAKEQGIDGFFQETSERY